VHELAADLAASISGSGTGTLLIDADFGNRTDLIEFRRSGYELETALVDPKRSLPQAGTEADVATVLGISIGREITDSPDVLARPEFVELLETAKDSFGAVVIACPPISTAGYHVLTQRLDAMILVSEIGALLPSEIDNALRTLEDRRALSLGVVLLTAARNPLRTAIARIRGGVSLRRETVSGWLNSQRVKSGEQQLPGKETSTASHDERVGIRLRSIRSTFATMADGRRSVGPDQSPTPSGSEGPAEDSVASKLTTSSDAPGPKRATVYLVNPKDRESESAHESSTAADTTAPTEVTDEESSAPAAFRGDGERAEQTETTASDTSPQEPTTRSTWKALGRNAKGQFTPPESPETTTDGKATGHKKRRQKASEKKAEGEDAPEVSSDPAAASEHSADATN
jgi:hypothetical protein